MKKSAEWVSHCKECGSVVYYAPTVNLYLKICTSQTPGNENLRIVDLECEGDKNGKVHTCTYEFPGEFIKR
jgi:hypothetical protein